MPATAAWCAAPHVLYDTNGACIVRPPYARLAKLCLSGSAALVTPRQRPTSWLANFRMVHGEVATVRACACVVAQEGGRTLLHVKDPTGFVKIEEDNLPQGDVVTVEVEQGEFIVTSNIMPHRSLPNHSDEMRWSCDWRWQDSRLPHGWARHQPPASWSGADGGCYRIEREEGWQVVPGPDPAQCLQHPWSWFDDDGVYHRA